MFTAKFKVKIKLKSFISLQNLQMFAIFPFKKIIVW